MTRSKIVTAALAAAVVLCAAAQTHAQSGWVGQEEVQSIAYTNTRAGATWPSDLFTGQSAFLRVPDLHIVASADGYYAGKTGVTNFQGATIEAGAIKFCTSVQPEWCALRPYASGVKDGTATRFIDTTATLGSNQPYIYTVEPDQCAGCFRAIWQGGRRQLILLRYQSTLSGFPQAFTGAASIGPYWLTIGVGASTALQNGTAFARQWCPAGTQNRNNIASIRPGTPWVSACPGVNAGAWTHNWSKSNVYSPIITR